MAKTMRFEHLNIRISKLFRISNFGFTISASNFVLRAFHNFVLRISNFPVALHFWLYVFSGVSIVVTSRWIFLRVLRT